jgi:hypothetical protein
VHALFDPASQGGRACLLDNAPDFGQGRPVLAKRGDLLLAHYLLAHNQSGNMWNPLRRITYFRLAAEGHPQRWRETHEEALRGFAPVKALGIAHDTWAPSRELTGAVCLVIARDRPS